MKKLNERSTIRELALLSLFIAMTVVLERFASINTMQIRIGFAFVPIACSAMLFGPLKGGLVASVADIIGATLFPTGAFFPGFTLSAFLIGTVYGLFLYRKPKTLLRLGAAVIINVFLINAALGSLWLFIMYGDAAIGWVPGRFLKALVMTPIEVIMLRTIWDQIFCRLKLQLKIN